MVPLNKIACVFRSEDYNQRDSSMSEVRFPAGTFLFATISAHVSNEWAAGAVLKQPERDTNPSAT
jgi:hypothetical protein